MSVVAQPIPHAFADPYDSASSLSQDEESPPLPRPILQLPTMLHTHSSPYPAQSLSFSALGPPDTLDTMSPPPAPKPTLPSLPTLTNNTSDSTQLPSSLPPTPDPSPPNSKLLLPDAVVPLAPPDEPRITILEPDSPSTASATTSAAPLDNILTPIQTNVTRARSLTAATANGEPVKPKTRHAIKRSQTSVILPKSQFDSRHLDRRKPINTRPVVPSNLGPRGSMIRSPTADSQLPRHQHYSPTPSHLGVESTSRFDVEAKAVLLGSQGAGKSTLLARVLTGEYKTEPATIGTPFRTHTLTINGTKVKLQIWDTAGQEKYTRSMAPFYYRDTQVCIVVYDITDRKSFEDVKGWIKELRGSTPEDTLIYVVGTKSDMDRQRTVSEVEAHVTIGRWLKGEEDITTTPVPPAVETFSRPSKQGQKSSLLRNTSDSSTDRGYGSPTRTPRSYSHGALVSLDTGESTPAVPPPKPSSAMAPPPPLVISPPTSKAAKRLSYTLASPSLPTSAMQVETATSPILPPKLGHGVSVGRFSFSGLLSGGWSPNPSGAVTTLNKVADDHSITANSPPPPHRLSPGSRVRTESSPHLSKAMTPDSSRRRSEEWSTAASAWRRGGPRAAEALGEFQQGVQQRENELSQNATLYRPGRARGRSLGRDSRLYGDDAPRRDSDGAWGLEIEIEGAKAEDGKVPARSEAGKAAQSGKAAKSTARSGECSAKTGYNVEILFNQIGLALVEREATIRAAKALRRQTSVYLTPDPTTNASQRQRSCCT